MTSYSRSSSSTSSSSAGASLKQNLHHLCEFLRIYVFDWHVLSALAIPLLFSLLFPAYWLIVCPQLWQARPGLYRPRTWLVAYWLFATCVWFVFLAVCFYRTRSGQKRVQSCRRAHSTSTEDLWSEDKYLPDTYLPSPDYLVSVSAIQPPASCCGVGVGGDGKPLVLDETWDYNFEEEAREKLRTASNSRSSSGVSSLSYASREDLEAAGGQRSRRSSSANRFSFDPAALFRHGSRCGSRCGSQYAGSGCCDVHMPQRQQPRKFSEPVDFFRRKSYFSTDEDDLLLPRGSSLHGGCGPSGRFPSSSAAPSSSTSLLRGAVTTTATSQAPCSVDGGHAHCHHHAYPPARGVRRKGSRSRSQQQQPQHQQQQQPVTSPRRSGRLRFQDGSSSSSSSEPLSRSTLMAINRVRKNNLWSRQPSSYRQPAPAEASSTSGRPPTSSSMLRKKRRHPHHHGSDSDEGDWRRLNDDGKISEREEEVEQEASCRGRRRSSGGGGGGSASDVVTDNKFELLLSSLQSLAVEIERDFDGSGHGADAEATAGMAGTTAGAAGMTAGMARTTAGMAGTTAVMTAGVTGATAGTSEVTAGITFASGPRGSSRQQQQLQEQPRQKSDFKNIEDSPEFVD